MILLIELINDLINLLEKAGKITRFFHEKKILSLLSQEKIEEKNNKFAHDYKTLADVLIQQMINYHLKKKYPKIDTIKGEENNQFTNSNGLSVEIELNDKFMLNDTLNLILDDNTEICENIINLVYEECLEENLKVNFKFSDTQINEETIGFWIDPIDSTNEYVKGEWKENQKNKLITNGLACVSCLLGVYKKSNGKAIIGVINLPFFKYQFNSFQGKCIWGVDYENCRLNNIETNMMKSSIKKEIIAISQTEDQKIIKKLSKEFDLINISGVGYKLYLLITNQIDAYLTTKPTTYKWDTCAANAILNSLNYNSNFTGNLLQFQPLFKNWYKDIALDEFEISYKLNENINNEYGLIGSKKKFIIHKILETLKQ